MIREVFRTQGGKALIASLLLFAISVAYFASVQLYNRKPPFHPLSYQNPAQILGITPISARGQIVHCNSNKQDIAVVGSYSARNVDTGTVVVQATDKASVWTPGCTKITPDIPIVNPLSPGRWRFEGNAVARSNDNQTQIAAWFSEPFEVTE